MNNPHAPNVDTRDNVTGDMVEGAEEISSGALEDIAYLARSANRVKLLVVLASGSYTRRELDDNTGIARTTIGRVVTEFEERGWVERTTDGEYTATPVGRQVVDEFTPLVESMAAIRKLRNLVAWLQATETPINLTHLSDATVIRPEQGDPREIIDYFIERIHDTSEFYTLNQLAPTGEFVEVLLDRLSGDQLTATFVLSVELVDYIRERPERRERWSACIKAGAKVYRFDQPIPCNLLILDETVFIANTQDKYGEPYTMIESDSEAVKSWAYDIISSHQADSERLDANMLKSSTTTEDE